MTRRRPELDALRGLMLILITVTHLPTRYAEWLSQPVGFVSAAEGFVFLSAYFVGMVYWRRGEEKGARAMAWGVWDRAALIWAWHVALLILLFSVISYLGLRTGQLAVQNMVAFYLAEPLTGLFTGAALLYNPPLLDILPMYVFFMLLTPLALLLGRRPNGWALVLAVSLTFWLLAQFGLGDALYAAIAAKVSVKVPLDQTGAFRLVAWQFLWVFGLWLGCTQERPRFPRWLVILALVIAVGCTLWRHAVGQAPFGGDAGLNLLFDKWLLGPLRLIDFMALLVVVVHFGPRLARLVRLRRLEVLGRASLPVFCAHLVIVLLALALFGDRRGELPLSFETLLLALVLPALYGVALIAGAVQSPSATAHSRAHSGEGRRPGKAPRAACRPRPASA